MPRKIGTLAELKTGLKAKIRSIPGVSAGTYLDLHVATLEGTRRERELITVNERKKRLEKEIEALQNEIKRMEQARHGDNGQKAQQHGEMSMKKPFKMMKLDY